ncbi:O-antigen ligase family protein [Xanthomarina sp. F2636L]|uniref:O-antigen ligase family protein n=1 Tax=Xanthomarina sp. F2636L TaxID=2996018 RepID=UPI00225E5891|nr:O-antigen ligase family protein [Xanthomarina sp. F2636L]MCX7551333.1 O-antigen ligase family protein [Xanthomarina sp. F2636L]
MIKINKSWESGFCAVSLLLLISIPFGYFLGNLAFALWSLYSFFWIIKKKSFMPNKQFFPLLFFSITLYASVLWSQDYASTLHGIGRQSSLFIFAIVGVFLPKLSKQKLKQVLNVYAVFLSALGVVFLAIAAFKYHKYQYKSFLYYHDLVSPLDLNAIYVSYIVSVVFLCTLNSHNRKNIWSLLVSAILFVFLIMLSSKMILFVTVLIGVGIVFFNIKSNVLKLSSVIVIAVLTFGVLTFFKPVQSRFLKEFDTSLVEIFKEESFKKGRVYTGLEARLLQVRVFTNIVNTPFEYVFGVGIDASKEEIKTIHQKLNTPKAFQSYNFHNQYIQVFAELGLIGIILLILVLIFGLKRSLKVHFLFPFIIVTMALFFTESVIWRQRGIMFFGIMYILLMITSSTYESKKSISKI